MLRIRQSISDRAAIYEERTGSNLPINVLAKVCELAGTLLFAEAFIVGGSTGEALVSAGLVVGGVAVDGATGGLRGYSQELRNRRDVTTD